MIQHHSAAVIFRAIRNLGRRATATLVLAVVLAIVWPVPDEAAAGPSCKPRRPKPVVVLRSMGPCAFDPDTLSFAGEPQEQAACLLRSLDRSRNLAPTPARLPAALANRVGRSSGLPAREALGAWLAKVDLEREFAATLGRPVSHARDNDPDAPRARYFVIHDTSGPNFGSRSFPSDIDVSPRINSLRLFFCADGWARSHVVVNRGGAIQVSHDFEIPWRETKLERAPRFAGALKGLFLHIELIQPRRRAPGFGRRNDAQAPTPGFTVAQYERLALLYVVASVRAGAWLIPAFHAAIDADIRGGHDDPQSFDIPAFAGSLAQLLQRLRGEEPLASSLP